LSQEDIQRAKEELEILEYNFRQMLQRTSRKGGGSGGSGIQTQARSSSNALNVDTYVSTPAIDALMQQGKPLSWSNFLMNNHANNMQQNEPTLKREGSDSGSKIKGEFGGSYEMGLSNLDEDQKPSFCSTTNTTLEDNDFENSDMDETTRKKIKLSERDHNIAASSLLGFFNHLQNNSSHEDLVDFFQDVQKTVSTSISKSISPCVSSNGLSGMNLPDGQMMSSTSSSSLRNSSPRHRPAVSFVGHNSRNSAEVEVEKDVHARMEKHYLKEEKAQMQC